MPTFGLRSQLAFAVGRPHEEWPTTGPRQVDIYAAGQCVTREDNSVYVPQFADDLTAAVGWLLEDRVAEPARRPYPTLSVADNHRRLCCAADAGDSEPHFTYQFMCWGPTTDDVTAHLFLEDGAAFIPFSFRRDGQPGAAAAGEVFVAELPERELLRVLHKAARTLALGGR